MQNERLPKVGEIYKHFKSDDTYQIVAISRHTETQEVFVVYKPISYELDWLKEENCDSAARPLSMFMDEIDRDGYKGPRFIKIK